MGEKTGAFESYHSTECLASFFWGYDLSGTEQGAGGVGGLVLVKQWSTTVNNGQLPSTSALAPCYDGNGNILAYMDCATGAVVQRMEYDAFGNELTLDSVLNGEGSSAREVPFRFSTKYTDAETNLSYYGYRYYLAAMGRWINRDPMEEQGGVNLYGIVGNDLVNYTDLLGQKTNSCSCDTSAIDHGEASLRSQAAEVKLQLGSGAATGISDDFKQSCKNNHSYLMSKLKIPVCWECRMEVGYTSFIGMLTNGDGGWKDHAVVICRSMNPEGDEVRRIILDITGGYTDPNKWRRNYPKPHPDQDSVWMSYTD